MKRIDLRGDESGMTLVELLVATAAGVVVMFGITTTLLVTMNATGRTAGRIHANQQARVTMDRIIDQLHSACVAPQIAPVQGDSTSTSLNFLHQTGSAVSPKPVLSKISLSGTTLSQTDYPTTGGAAPNWKFSTTPSATTVLMTNVSPISGSVPLFRYYGYSKGQIAATPLSSTPKLTEENAALTVQVNVAFKVTPPKTPVTDANAAALLQGSALLRLTPPSYNANATSNLPCQ